MITESLRHLADLKLKTSEQLDIMGEDLLKDLNSLQELRTTINKERQRLLDSFQEQKRALEAMMVKVKEQWTEEQLHRKEELEQAAKQQESARSREEEEYRYQLALEKRKATDEYEIKKQERERVVKVREEAIGRREQEILVMETELSALSERIDREVKKATAEVSKTLQERHTDEIQRAKLAHEHEQKIAELTITGLGGTVKAQGSEIESLKRQLGEAQRQLKDMAIAVIEARSSKAQATPDESGKE